MTLDETIKYEEEIAEENQRVVDTGILFDDVTVDMLYCDDTEVIEDHLANYQECANTYRQIAEWLKELKQLRKQTRWIPVSEGLPNFNDIVLASTNSDYDELRIVMTVYNAERFWFDGKITAWQPLPKEYKEESEAKNG